MRPIRNLALCELLLFAYEHGDSLPFVEEQHSQFGEAECESLRQLRCKDGLSMHQIVITVLAIHD